MKINVFGMGYVGSVSAACLARDGHDVLGIDVDAGKVQLLQGGQSPVVENGLPELLQNVVRSGRLSAATTIAREADVSIVCVGTPSNENGSLQLHYVQRVTEQIAAHLGRSQGYHVVVYRSTMLPGTVEEVLIPILERLSGKGAGAHFGVCMVPEFLREGTSLHDYVNPPFTVVGELDQRSGDALAGLFEGIGAPLLRTDIRVAEMVKYTCNVFHALKVTFANEVGNVCKALGVDSHKVMDIFCRDGKLNLSPYYLSPGFAFGGSCLPKDVRAMVYKARERDVDVPVLGSILGSNRLQVEVAFRMVSRAGKKNIGLLGLSFKPGTDDLRESPMVELAEKLIGKGYALHIYDREVNLARIVGSNKRFIDQVIPHLSSLMHDEIAEVIRGAEVVIVAKRSPEYKAALESLGGGKIVVDLARIGVREGEGYQGICW